PTEVAAYVAVPRRCGWGEQACVAGGEGRSEATTRAPNAHKRPLSTTLWGLRHRADARGLAPRHTHRSARLPFRHARKTNAARQPSSRLAGAALENRRAVNGSCPGSV